MKSINRVFKAMLCGFALVAFGTSAGWGYTGDTTDCRNVKATDSLNSKTYGCYCKQYKNKVDFAWGSGVTDGVLIFGTFPNLQKCVYHSGKRNEWKTVENVLCEGFVKEKFEPNTMTLIGERSGIFANCWKWECKQPADARIKMVLSDDKATCNAVNKDLYDEGTGGERILCDTESAITVKDKQVAANTIMGGKCIPTCPDGGSTTSRIDQSDPTEFRIILK